jgi:hypothetical protein
MTCSCTRQTGQRRWTVHGVSWFVAHLFLSYNCDALPFYDYDDAMTNGHG